MLVTLLLCFLFFTTLYNGWLVLLSGVAPQTIENVLFIGLHVLKSTLMLLGIIFRRAVLQRLATAKAFPLAAMALMALLPAGDALSFLVADVRQLQLNIDAGFSWLFPILLHLFFLPIYIVSLILIALQAWPEPGEQVYRRPIQDDAIDWDDVTANYSLPTHAKEA